MQSINSSSNTDSEIAVQRNASCYLPSSSAASILWEQMEYLMSHDGVNCHPGCLDCRRLALVKKDLLQPFA